MDAKTDLIVKTPTKIFTEPPKKIITEPPTKIITEPPKKKQVKYACVSIKINLGHSPPFKRVPSLICTAMILSYVGTRRVVYILLQSISHTSRAYCLENKSTAIETFVKETQNSVASTQVNGPAIIS